MGTNLAVVFSRAGGDATVVAQSATLAQFSYASPMIAANTLRLTTTATATGSVTLASTTSTSTQVTFSGSNFVGTLSVFYGPKGNTGRSSRSKGKRMVCQSFFFFFFSAFYFLCVPWFSQPVRLASPRLAEKYQCSGVSLSGSAITCTLAKTIGRNLRFVVKAVNAGVTVTSPPSADVLHAPAPTVTAGTLRFGTNAAAPPATYPIPSSLATGQQVTFFGTNFGDSEALTQYVVRLGKLASFATAGAYVAPGPAQAVPAAGSSADSGDQAVAEAEAAAGSVSEPTGELVPVVAVDSLSSDGASGVRAVRLASRAVANTLECAVTEVTDSYITCTTPLNTLEDGTLLVFYVEVGQPVAAADCATTYANTDCPINFFRPTSDTTNTYSYPVAPSVSAVRGCTDQPFAGGSGTETVNCPTSGLHATTGAAIRITIEGLNFGSDPNMVVSVGEEFCTDVSVPSDTQLTCTLPASVGTAKSMQLKRAAGTILSPFFTRLSYALPSVTSLTAAADVCTSRFGALFFPTRFAHEFHPLDPFHISSSPDPFPWPYLS